MHLSSVHELVRIALPEDVVEAYQVQAKAAGVGLEALLADRLLASVTHTAKKPIYFTDDQRRELDQLFGKNLQTATDVLVQVRKMLSVKIENVKISLKPSLLSRLKTRCLGMRWEDFLERIIVEDLERYVGIR